MSFLQWLIEPIVECFKEESVTPLPLTPSIDNETRKWEEIGVNGGEKWEISSDSDIKNDLKVQSTQKSTIFRPLTFSQYIGQDKVKNILKDYIKGTSEREMIFPHTLVHSNAGCGKTTLVRIIANSLKVKLIESISSDIKDFEELKQEIIKCEGGVLFLDEIHSLDRNSAEKLYTIMEDFTYKGNNIKPFTLIGATTEIGEIIENRKPFFDRFKLILELEDYEVNDLIQITKQYKNQMFIKDKIHGKVYRIIAKNSKFTPRNSIRLLEATIYTGDIYKVLDNFNIVKNGYTKKDFKLLEYLKVNGIVGMQGIVSYLATSQANYLYEIEPYLLKTGLIVRTARGRKISNEGTKLLTYKPKPKKVSKKKKIKTIKFTKGRKTTKEE